MKAIGFKKTAGCMLLAVMTLAVGCISQSAVYRDIRKSRDEAYQSWMRSRERGDIPIPAEALSLAESIRIALLYNKTLQAKIQEREAARGELVSAHQLALPHVSAAASTTYGTTDGDAASMTFRQPVFRGGGATAGLRAARLYAFWSDENVRDTVQKVIQEVTADYYDAVLAENLCQVNRDAVTSAEAHLNDVRVKLVNGVASKYDELRAQVDVANFRAELIRQNNRLVLAKTSLLRTLGTATDAQINLSDSLKHAPVTVTLEGALQEAYRNRPDLYMAELNIRIQREKIRAIRGTYLPEVDLVLSLASDRDRSDDDPWHGESQAGLELTWPLFDGFGREGELITERARLRQREIELADAQQSVFLDVRQVLLNLKNAEENVESQRLNLQNAGEGLRLAMTGYREGVKTEVEVVDARSSLTEARGNYYQALYDHCVARLSLERAMGVLGKDLDMPARAADKKVPLTNDPEARITDEVKSLLLNSGDLKKAGAMP